LPCLKSFAFIFIVNKIVIKFTTIDLITIAITQNQYSPNINLTKMNMQSRSVNSISLIDNFVHGHHSHYLFLKN